MKREWGAIPSSLMGGGRRGRGGRHNNIKTLEMVSLGKT